MKYRAIFFNKTKCWLFIFFHLLLFNHKIIAATPINIEKTNSPAMYLKHWQQQNPTLVKNALILLDLDDTLITTPNWVGSSDFFYKITDEMKTANVLHHEDQYAAIGHLYDAMENHVKHILVDKNLPKVIAQLKQQGATVLGFTARTFNSSAMTLNTVEKLGLFFSSHAIQDSQNVILHSPLVGIDHGILFTGHKGKGDALVRLLKSKNLQNLSAIVFIDDKMNNLTDAKKAMQENRYASVFHPVQCTAVAHQKGPYNPKQADCQTLSFIVHNKDFSDMHKAMQKSEFFHYFFKTRCQPSLGYLSDCKNYASLYCTELKKVVH